MPRIVMSKNEELSLLLRAQTQRSLVGGDLRPERNFSRNMEINPDIVGVSSTIRMASVNR